MNKNVSISIVAIFALTLTALACSSATRTTTTTYNATPVSTESSSVFPVASNTPVEPKSTSTPEPQIDLQMGNYTSYTDSIGSLWFVGEILNKGNASAESVDIALSLLDSNGNVVGVGTDMLSYVPANGKFPFKILVNDAPKEWKDVKIQIQGSPSGGFLSPYVDFKTDKVTGQPSTYGTYGLTGTVINIGEKTATLVHIVAVAYDKDGKVVDVADTFSALTDIAPGGDSPFSIDFLNLTDTPASYELFVVSYTK
jgi:hypothetical protein